jgi:dTDP-4-amino-4,6-dideoxygalactose transaminase
MDPIPLVDLSIQNQEVAQDVRRAMDRVIEQGSFVHGPALREFEEAFARYSEVTRCVGVGNGGDALELMLRAHGVGSGDEVILPANTFVATALAVARTGADPVLADSDPVHHLIDPGLVEAAASPLTKAIIAVHLFGQIAPMEELQRIAEGHGLLLFEDAAQSQGARRNGRRAGSLGSAAATSFYPGKNLGAYGDAGGVLTSDDAVADRVSMIGDYGSSRKYEHVEFGFNSRLDTLQAAVLSVKLTRLDGWNQQRREAAARYDSLLADHDRVKKPRVLPGNEPVWHLYVIEIPERDRVFEALQAEGIGVGIHYPTPVHLQGAFSHLGHTAGSFPNAESAADRMLSLPIYPGIREDQQVRVAEALRKALG